MSCCKKIVITIKLPDCYSEPSECGQGTGGNQGSSSQPIPTPLLVIPCLAGDQGTRPVPVATALANQSIQVDIANPAARGGWNEFQIQLSCVIANLGSVQSAAALVDFYAGAALWAAGHDTLSPAQVQADVHLIGRGTGRVPPGSAATVFCSKYWVPGSAAAAQQGVLVQARDLLMDPITTPFDAINDRHVARNDQVMASVIISQGAATLKGTYLFDLDVGVQSGRGGVLPGADIWWEQKTVALRQMTPQNGASITNLGPVDFNSLAALYLQSLAYASTPIVGNNDSTNELVNGDVFAVRTTGGNYAKVLVTAYGYDMGIQWVTYAAPP